MAVGEGRRAGEKVRRAHPRPDPGGDASHAAPDAGEDYGELLCLDSAGRLQIPKAYREALGLSLIHISKPTRPY